MVVRLKWHGVGKACGSVGVPAWWLYSYKGLSGLKWEGLRHDEANHVRRVALNRTCVYLVLAKCLTAHSFFPNKFYGHSK